jgi:hypothetical protein
MDRSRFQDVDRATVRQDGAAARPVSAHGDVLRLIGAAETHRCCPKAGES